MATYAGRGDVYLHAERNGARVKQILWGDKLNVVETKDGWHRVTWGTEEYWIPVEDCQEERPLEVIFLDVGQGDGCLIVSPEEPPAERIMIVDAGAGDNMFRFIRWRFGKLKKDFRFHAAVITHSDSDHYAGFQETFSQPKLHFDKVYHNGIAERMGDDLFGPSEDGFLTELMETHEQIRDLYDDEDVRGRKMYPRLMHTALTSGRVGSIEMLSTRHGKVVDNRTWMPGFSPAENAEFTIEVLGPVVEPDAQGKARLRWFGDTVGSTGRDEGKTKNGHSVLMRLSYRNFSMFLGGDLNRPAEDFLLRHYGKIAANKPLADAVQQAKRRFSSDVMKSCHHGSADVTDEFLSAVNPFAFVVSSGDQESHVHPRPDLLGRLGRRGRGETPLILCTEILRSTRETEDAKLLRRLQRLDVLIEEEDDVTERNTLKDERIGIQKQLAKRNVEVYGAITLRTDGRHLAIAFRMEKERAGRAPKRWHVYWYRHDEQKGFLAENADAH
jgi:beta-lactamase superfamily II metal-dependent hydrolase